MGLCYYPLQLVQTLTTHTLNNKAIGQVHVPNMIQSQYITISRNLQVRTPLRSTNNTKIMPYVPADAHNQQRLRD